MSEKIENMETAENVEDGELAEEPLTDGELEQIDGGFGYRPYQPPKFRIFCPYCDRFHGVEVAGSGAFQIDGITPGRYRCGDAGRFFLVVSKGVHSDYYTGDGVFLKTE